MKVPFLDLKAQYVSIKGEIETAIKQVIDSCAFAGGPFVEKFENEFSEFCGSKYAIGVGSGTEALWISLMALGIGSGDEVITVPNTFIATAEAVSMCGATPVFVDVDDKTYNMDVSKIEEAISKNTKALIPVHLFGHMSDMDPILEIAKKYNLFIIEDACQAHGAEYNGKKSGTIGDIGCFSFYPGKNLGAYGDAGVLVTNNNDVANKTRMLRDHGQDIKYHHKHIGFNCRMDGIQAAILSVKLRYLNSWNEARRRNAKIYSSLLEDAGEIYLPIECGWAKHVYHIYAVRIKNRNELISVLNNKNIQTGIHYPIPIHLQKAYEILNRTDKKLLNSEKFSDELISLPMYPELKSIQIEYVSEQIKKFLKKRNCSQSNSLIETFD